MNVLMSIEAMDDISEDDPVLLYVDFEEGVCWLEVSRLGIRMLHGFSAHWKEGRWWRRTAEYVGEVLTAQDSPSSSDEIADAVFEQLSAREELGGRTTREAIRSALDEQNMRPLAIGLEVLES